MPETIAIKSGDLMSSDSIITMELATDHIVCQAIYISRPALHIPRNWLDEVEDRVKAMTAEELHLPNPGELISICNKNGRLMGALINFDLEDADLYHSLPK